MSNRIKTAMRYLEWCGIACIVLLFTALGVPAIWYIALIVYNSWRIMLGGDIP